MPHGYSLSLSLSLSLSAMVKPNNSAPSATRPGLHAPKITRATAIQPRPATTPSLQWPTKSSER